MKYEVKPFKVYEFITAHEILYGVEFIFTGEFVITCLTEGYAKMLTNKYNQEGLKRIEWFEKDGTLEKGSLSAARFYLRNPEYWEDPP